MSVICRKCPANNYSLVCMCEVNQKLALAMQIIEKLEKSNAFYADKFSWCCQNESPNAYRILPHDRSETSKAKLTGGRLARQTLKEVEAMKEGLK